MLALKWKRGSAHTRREGQSNRRGEPLHRFPYPFPWHHLPPSTAHRFFPPPPLLLKHRVQVRRRKRARHLLYRNRLCQITRLIHIGAGTITCNYDGANKHHTQIGDYAFIGSHTQLIAPITVGANVTIAAGTTLSKDAPEGALTLARVPQRSNKSWQRPKKVD